MIFRNDRSYVFMISLLVILMVTLPFVIAAWIGDGEYVFGGFLLNPLDGNTYLAKIYQGAQGNWRFKLPYTAQPGNGAYLNLFYLGLGHFSRLLKLPLLTIFHLARLLGCIFLLFTLWNFFGAFFDKSRPRRLAFALASLGSGMGWLVLFVGLFTSDFWVAETYPFLSFYTNPHFSIGLAIVLWMVKPRSQKVERWGSGLLIAIGAFFLGIINPFGIVITLVVLGGNFIWNLVEKSYSVSIVKQILLTSIFGFPFLFYDLWVMNTDPVFMGWNAQNLTPSPPFWDLIISLSPAMFFGLWGMAKYRKTMMDQSGNRFRPLVAWLILGLILVYLPVGLQRRFMMGLYVPISGLAALGFESLGDHPGRIRLITICLGLLALPTNLVILLSAQVGIANRDPSIYLDMAEVQTLDWIETNTEPDALVLSSPDMGLYIPAYTGRRVIYGHPFETVNAETEEALVQKFFKGGIGELEMGKFIIDRDVDYIFFGPRERSLSEFRPSKDWQLVFTSGDVALYKITEELVP